MVWARLANLTSMKLINGSLLLATAVSAAYPAWSVEANFRASFLVYGNPTSTPAVAYSVPAGSNFSFFTDREVADDVTLSGTDRIIAGVAFEYYANYAETGGLMFRMYERANSGVPGALIYSIPLDILQGGGLVDIAFSYDVTNVLPDQFFYSVQFAGVQQGNVAGMIVPDQSATSGSSADQVLEKRGNKWLEVDLNSGRGRRVGLRREGNSLRLAISDAPRTVVTVESTSGLGVGWNPVGQVETDDNGDAEFAGEIDTQDQVFYRTVVP